MNTLFSNEAVRDRLAKDCKYRHFKETYLDVNKIKDINTKDFWEHLTEENKEMLSMSPVYKDKVNKIVRYLQNKSGKLLDISFGHGDIEKNLQRYKSLNLFGTEISEYLVGKIEKSFSGTFKVGNIYKLPFKSNYFDFILTLDVLEHLPTNKTFKAYKEISRVLKQEGKLIVSVPMNEGLEGMLEKGENPNGHLRAYTPGIIKTELKLSGFKVFNEKYLYAFEKCYFWKSLLVNLLPFKIKKPNLIIVFAKKYGNTFSC